MKATDEEKYLIANPAYLEELATYLVSQMYTGNIDQYIGYLANFFKRASIMQLSFKLLSSTILQSYS